MGALQNCSMRLLARYGGQWKHQEVRLIPGVFTAEVIPEPALEGNGRGIGSKNRKAGPQGGTYGRRHGGRALGSQTEWWGVTTWDPTASFAKGAVMLWILRRP